MDGQKKMRLIDADKALKSFEGLFEALIDVAETVEPLKHGHWIYKKRGNAQCSCCGQYIRDVYDDDNEDRYCRHCGAKMDEKEEAKQK